MTSLRSAQEGVRGRAKLIEFARVVLQAYLDTKGLTSASEAEIREKLQGEKTIMAHILCHSYPTHEHRLSDVIVFLVAGHETTGEGREGWLRICFNCYCCL